MTSGDVIEMKTDRVKGELSFRIYRKGEWIDLGRAFSNSQINEDILYAGISLYEVGDAVSVVDCPKLACPEEVA